MPKKEAQISVQRKKLCLSEKLFSVDEVQVDRITLSFSFLNRDTF